MTKTKQVGHNDRPDIAGEHPLGDTGQLILLIVFLIIWIADSFIFKYSIHLQDSIPLAARLLGSAVIIIQAILIVRNGLKIVFGEIRENPIVIDKGPFTIVRHPIYLGAIAFYLGFIVATLSIVSAVAWVFIVIFYYFISRHEEKLLINKFGKEYQYYMARVPMLMPKLFKTNRKLYIGILLLFHGVIFTVIMQNAFFFTIGILLYFLGGIYLVIGIKNLREKNAA